ncbi:Uncharacterised protein [uncultured archaeon]|nr:Uncharacterised protein [uncultured archaeon]
MEFFNSDEAVSEVVGNVFILALTIVGVASITLLGVPSIQRLEDMADVRNTEQTFATLDSRVSSAIIGDSPMKTVNINLGGGSLVVEPNGTGRESYMVIKSVNNTFNITIPMGKVKYSLGDRIVAYEGGGVWSKYPAGSVMISPPEFHYDGKTLTLPVSTINGNADIAGKGTAVIIFEKNSTIVLFPNTTIDINRTNPLSYNLSGKVYVNITSDFYDAWADYARDLLYTGVSTDPANRKTSVELKVVPSSLGGSNPISYPINMWGLPGDNTPLDKWSFRIYSNHFNSLNWDIRASSPGNKRLIYQLTATNTYATVKAGYEDDGQGYDDSAETWSSGASFPIQGTAPNQYVDIDLLNKSINLTYTSVSQVGNNNGGSNNGAGCQYIDKISGSQEFNDTAFSWSSPYITKFNANKTQSLYNVTQHYLWIMAQSGDFFFNKCQNGENGPEPNSTMVLGYNATGTLRFLQISEYNVSVDIR